VKIIRPAAGPLHGSLALPGDKSVSHRALILGALAEGRLTLRNVPSGQDVRSTRTCLAALGVRFLDVPGAVVVEGAGLSGLRAPGADLDCGNSGTTMRLLTGVLAGQGFDSVLTGDASLSRRPMRRVAGPLERMGACVSLAEDGRPPVRIRGRRPLTSAAVRLEVPSAQVKSAVLLAGLFAEGETEVDDPFGTRDHTERMLAALGAGESLRRRGSAALIRPCALRTGFAWDLPGDVSTAAFFAAAAALIPGSSLALRGMLLNPRRLGFFLALREMGGDWAISGERETGGEPVGDVVVRHAPLRALRVKAERVPSMVDEIPLLAVLAAAADGESRLEGVGELRLKESDRIAGTLAGLRALGAEARADGEDLIVRGPTRFQGAALESGGDHRLAMAFAVAALAAHGESGIADAGCAAVSHPSFFEDLEALR